MRSASYLLEARAAYPGWSGALRVNEIWVESAAIWVESAGDDL